MNKLYHLSTCSTCIRIIKGLEADKNFQSQRLSVQDIKTEKITVNQIDEMAKLAGSYENLFSRRAMKYKSMGLKDKNLDESDYKRLILEQYTFLKRPVVILNNQIFIGNSKNVVEDLKNVLTK